MDVISWLLYTIISTTTPNISSLNDYTCSLSKQIQYDIIVLDTGNTIDYYGQHTLGSIGYDTNGHGTEMSRTVIDQLQKQSSSYSTLNAVVFNGYTNMYYVNWQNYLTNLECVLKSKTKVISYSSGGEFVSSLEESIFKKNPSNALFVTAAGNNGEKKYYPGDYNLPCILKVGTKKNHRNIYQTKAEVYLEQLSNESGTSFSTARMSAIVLDYWKKNPSLTCQQIEEKMKQMYGDL